MFKDSVNMCVYHVNVWICVCMYVEFVVSNICLCVKYASKDIFMVRVCVYE